jgi:hypothetical protein
LSQSSNDIYSSHANVHSSSRPHYCPVKGCPRGEGGKGFKRKNEMIRHGLVHDSPGYVCPFCPLREHRYPRPDNLQRCVSSIVGINSLTNIIVAGMFVSTMWIKIRTTLCFERFWPSDLKAVAEDAAGAQAPLENAKPPSILCVPEILNREQHASIRAALWFTQFTFCSLRSSRGAHVYASSMGFTGLRYSCHGRWRARQ